MSATVSTPTQRKWPATLCSGRPHQIISTAATAGPGGETVTAPYLHRWFALPRNRWFNLYLQTGASSALLHSQSTSRVGEFTELCPWIACRQYGATPVLSGGLSAMTSGVLPSTPTNTNER